MVSASIILSDTAHETIHSYLVISLTFLKNYTSTKILLTTFIILVKNINTPTPLE